MINLGIIGTNWITRQFVDAAIETGKYQLTAVYSRRLETAQTFGKNYGEVAIAADLSDFFALENMDTVYIASPNGMHFEQAKQAILAGKNVIVEKSAVSTPQEMEEIIRLANEKKVFFFEAARNIHEKSYQKIGDFICSKGRVIGANFTYMKYSSRYDQVLAGEEPNIFSAHFSGGAMMDLGVYLVYAALGWFGTPKATHYFAQKIDTGVDVLGIGILRYEDFDVALQPGKIGDAFLPSEIYFEKGTLILNGVNAIEKATYFDRITQETEEIPVHVEKNPMVEEAENFAQVIMNPQDKAWGEKYEEWVELARSVNAAVYAMRTEAGVIFDADKKEE